MKPLAAIIILGVLIGAGFYYRDSLAQKIADLYPTQTVPPTPDLAVASPTPSPTVAPTAVPTATPLPSIAQIDNGQPLPTSGPGEDIALAAGAAVVAGGAMQYLQARTAGRRRIDIV